VSAAPVVPTEVALHGASNLRDLGGYPAHGGRRVRSGLVFRSASLSGLTDDDLVALGRLGLRTVCDLRGEAERERAPSRLPRPGPALLTLSIEPTVGASLRDIQARGAATGEDVVTLLGRAYQAYATTQLHQFRALLRTLLEPGRLPLLFHCSAGKDRTGFGAALLLTALGVPREAVVEDYRATDRLWRGTPGVPDGSPAAVTEALRRTHPELLVAALDTALGDGAEADLERALGLDVRHLAALREALLE